MFLQNHQIPAAVRDEDEFTHSGVKKLHVKTKTRNETSLLESLKNPNEVKFLLKERK